MPDEGRKRARLGWVLPPALALLAVVLQFAIDVPHHAMIVHSDRDPPKRSTTTAARTPRPSFRARGLAYTKRLRKSWSNKPIAREPRDPRFAPHHEQLLRAVTRKAEASVAPEQEAGEVTTLAKCHTIRCELELCGPEDIVGDIVEVLPEFEVGRRSLWHELREVGSEQDDEQTCQRYLVDFAVEGADPRRLRLGR